MQTSPEKGHSRTLQACNESIAHNADCETFRFAQVLSAGGLVVSEPCPDRRDEADWAGRMLRRFDPLKSSALNAC